MSTPAFTVGSLWAHAATVPRMEGHDDPFATDAPQAPETKLRIGVMLRGLDVPAWAAWIVHTILNSETLDLALVIRTPAQAPQRSALFNAYERLDRLLFRNSPDATALVSIAPALSRIARLDLAVASGLAGSLTVSDASLAAVRRASLDVIINLPPTSAPASLADATRHGVWSVLLGDPARDHEPPIFGELTRAKPATASILDAALPGGRRAVIYRSYTATDPVSLERTRNPTYWKSASFVLRRLHDLSSGRWKPSEETATRADPAPGQRPTELETLRHVARLVRRVGTRKLEAAAFRKQWILGLRQRRPDCLPAENPEGWRAVVPPGDRYWADPFVVERGGATYVFFEEVRWSRGKGELAVARVEAGGTLVEPQVVMSAPHHLSYPYVLQDSDCDYMIPESGEAARIDLWAATAFPHRWERIGPLIEGVHAVDASILKHNDLYWMWANVAVPGARRDDEALLFYSDRLDSGWTPHPRNPVVSDARSARPAGRPFVHGGTIIRPAQDCTGRYGARVVFNEVDLLTEDDYREHAVGSLGPGWGGDGNRAAHTYTFAGRWEATDALRLRPRWRRAPMLR
jgi:hypothetical protein